MPARKGKWQHYSELRNLTQFKEFIEDDLLRLSNSEWGAVLMGKFITDQILGMKWLNTLIGNLLNTLGLDATSRIGGNIQLLSFTTGFPKAGLWRFSAAITPSA